MVNSTTFSCQIPATFALLEEDPKRSNLPSWNLDKKLFLSKSLRYNELKHWSTEAQCSKPPWSYTRLGTQATGTQGVRLHSKPLQCLHRRKHKTIGDRKVKPPLSTKTLQSAILRERYAKLLQEKQMSPSFLQMNIAPLVAISIGKNLLYVNTSCMPYIHFIFRSD